MVASAKPDPFQHGPEGAPAPARGAQELPAALQRLLPALRVLVIEADPAVAASVREAVDGVEGRVTGRRSSKPQAGPPKVYTAEGLTRAQQLLRRLASRREPVDLVLLDEGQAGAANPLAEVVAGFGPEAGVIVTSGQPSLAGSLEAFRCGALDYLPKPLDGKMLAQRIRLAAGRRYLQVKDQRRLQRLKGAVRQLNQARRTVGQKVDLLCQDLVGAYSELSRQVERLRVAGHFRTLLAGAADLEQMLCHAMDWILRELGHCNIAIFLTDDAGKSELGAYMKHTVAGDDRVTRWLARHIVPKATADGFLHAGGAEGTLGAELKTMQAQAIAAVDCTYLAESLGKLIIFRKADKPFSGEELSLLKAAGPVFATALANMVRASESKQSPSEEDDRDDREWWRRSA